ncbi:lymphocyte function-associated antigen 3 [Sylvia atricapilla]|uniref:lymphocyte function-associated antigen 3 n=1 Tax=Sylvia atricapilla TaxID=48155 RepID=UPI0033952525
MWLRASLWCLTPLLAHIYCKEVIGLAGENFTFPVQIDKKIMETVWKKSKNKVAEWEEQSIPTYFGPLRNRSVLLEDGSLTIVNLQKDDAGPYELQYRDSVEDHYLDFVLVVLDSLPEPKISCNASDGELVLNCIAYFQRSLNYVWKLSNDPHSHPNQVLSIPLKNVDTTANATCTIKFSQTERSSEISLIQCLPEEKGDSSSERNRSGLIGAIIAVIILVAIVGFLVFRKGNNCGTGRAAQNNSPGNGSGEQEQLFPGNSQQQPNSEGAACSRTVHCEDEEPEADRALNEDDGALKDKQIVKNGVNQGEVTQDAEGENEEHLNNSSS